MMERPERDDVAGAETPVAETPVADTRALEALFFVSDEPLTASLLAQALDVDRRTVEALCDRLQRDLEDRGSGLVLRNVAGGWRLYTHPDTASVVEQFVLSSRQARLTKAALETLSIVAYKQPVTRHQVSGIRGVNSDGVLRALADRGLIEEAGRDESPGRPVLYATTPGFLERLGLPSLASLPALAPLLDPASDADPLAEVESDAPDASDEAASGTPGDDVDAAAPDES
ncbi:MAG: SMC-Scp complex subunit ScpB [Actinomycetota bacterium]|nr:SMC-Scp complex subunit ScpB [Actinomycetota bacterium]MDH5223255.1 SMC-Scp complex subunit ScpB [Actinomycetota bacterium]MDH5313082.1 SMC-Scp complex subunit ScpB [Actinomycetota bacterium]